MKFIIIPPYQNPVVKWEWVEREHMANLKKKGALEGVEVDYDDGPFIDSPSASRDEVTIAYAALGIVEKVKKYSEMGKHDAIILTGGCDPGFVAGRSCSKVPVVAGFHSSLHVASLIGDKTSVIHGLYELGPQFRFLALRFGFNDKLVSARCHGHTTTEMYTLINKYKDKKEARAKDPEIKKVIDDIANAGITAIEKDRADSLIIPDEASTTFEDEVRKRLDKAGYTEIPIICMIPACIEMAKTMVNMKLVQSARAFPTNTLKAIPEYH